MSQGKIEGVDLVLGNSSKYQLLEEVIALTSEDYHGSPLKDDLQPALQAEPVNFLLQEANAENAGRVITSKEFIPSFSYGDRTRSFLKIQDGCDYYCSYCTIPLARGHSRSDTIEHILHSAREISANGVREIVLTGVNIGDFGKQHGESFIQLIRALDKLEEIVRIRISSVEPDLLSDEIIDVVSGSGKFMPHFHIPLQSEDPIKFLRQ